MQDNQFRCARPVSSAAPEQLTLSERFDCVLAVSLFSHLPEETFARWLGRLYDLLHPGGMLVFTIHDLTLLADSHRKAQHGDIAFFPVSEETLIPRVNRPLDTKDYGTTYVSEAFVRRAIEEVTGGDDGYGRHARGLAGYQDIYVLNKDRRG